LHFEWYLFESAGRITHSEREAGFRGQPLGVADGEVYDIIAGPIQGHMGISLSGKKPINDLEAVIRGFTPGQPIAYKVRVVDAEDGDSAKDEELMDSHVFVTAHWNRDDGKEEAGQPNLAVMRQ
jgi:hypothetical protein